MMKLTYLLMHPFYLLVFMSCCSHLYNSINLIDAFTISSRGISEFTDMLLDNTPLRHENNEAAQLIDVCNETKCDITENILLSSDLNMSSFEVKYFHLHKLKIFAKFTTQLKKKMQSLLQTFAIKKFHKNVI
uniref:Secreted protein n=1 Tax=Ascaris lumbricoides TaxID=6252 RepID=A0A0M3IMV7_ASCLU